MGMTRDKLKRKKAISTEHFVPADEAQEAELAAANQELGLARFTGSEEAIEKAEARVAAAEQAIRDEGLVFKIVSVGRKRFDALLLEHPVTDDQKAAAAERGDEPGTFNPDTFWPAIFAESIEGALTPEEWREDVLDSKEWGSAEIRALKDKVFAVHTTSRVAELGN